MKKITLTTITTILGVLLFALPAFAATTASIAPASINVTSGQRFSVAVSVNPQGTANYAEKLEINYPADMLEVTSFTLGSNWISMAQPGYDLTDNTNGVLIKTAGYPGGITSLTPFGTVTFSAKKAGSGTIKIGNNSLAFQASSQTVITGNSTTLTITAPVVAPKVIPKETIPSTPTETEQVTDTTSTTSTTIIDQTPQVAAVTTAVPAETSGNSWVWIIFILVILLVILGVYKASRK